MVHDSRYKILTHSKQDSIKVLKKTVCYFGICASLAFTIILALFQLLVYKNNKLKSSVQILREKREISVIFISHNMEFILL
jgi:hypothetical protein